MEARPILLIRLRRHENRFVDIRIELLRALTWVEPLQTVLLECVDKDGVGHLDAVM